MPAAAAADKKPMRGLSSLVIFWFVLSTIIVAIDGIYIHYRPAYVHPTAEDPTPQQLPHPLKENPIVGGWDMYAAIDHRYQPSPDSSFLNTVLVGNAVEGVLMAVAILYSVLGATVEANAVSFAVNIMIFYKTFVYYTLNVMEGGKYTAHVGTNELVWMFYVPALPWFICPLLCAKSNVRRIKAAGMQLVAAAAKKVK